MSTSVVRPEPAVAQPPTRTRALATVTAEDRFVEDGWRAAVFSYNHSDEYVENVLAVANAYAK